MQASNERSVEQMRAEAERNRYTLATTVQELRERVGDSATEIKDLISPANIKQEIRDYVRQERESAVNVFKRKVSENPLQVAAVAAAVAYPALGLLRALPAPLWLIAGGLFLTSKRGRTAAAGAQKEISAVAHLGAERFSDVTSAVGSELHDRVSNARMGMEEIQHNVSERVGSIADKTRAAIHDVKDGAANLASAATSSAKEAVDDLANLAQSNRSNAKSFAREITPSPGSVGKLLTDNALLIAGIGAALGAVLAASIPRSEAENKLFGAGSEKIKDQARKMAESGVQKAGDFVATTAGDVAVAAAREGLNASVINNAVSNVIDGVRAVADRGIDKALGNEIKKTENNHDQMNTQRNS